MKQGGMAGLSGIEWEEEGGGGDGSKGEGGRRVTRPLLFGRGLKFSVEFQ